MVGLLARPPRPPRDPSLFSSNTLFGEPGIYPAGPPMEPAAGPAPDEHAARAALATLLPDHLGDPAAVSAALGLFDHPGLVARVPDPGPRAAAVLLRGTVGAPALAALLAGSAAADRLVVEAMPGAGRVLGESADGARTRALNDRYRAEHPALVTPSLAHDLLWAGPGATQAEEALLHALLAMTHLQTIARSPWIAHLGTELARRQNSLAVTLLNSRHPASDRISLMAPDGPGTIPGGAPTMQTTDFWSIPFVRGGPTEGRLAPPALAAVLGRLVDDPRVELPSPVRFGRDLADLLSRHLGRRWLPVLDQLRAAVALGLLDVAEVADATGLAPPDAARRLGLSAALACWDR